MDELKVMTTDKEIFPISPSNKLAFTQALQRLDGWETGPVVYFVKCNKFIKIGFAADSAPSRVSFLQTGNPYPLELLFVHYGATLKLEREYHRKYSRYRHRGEWFHHKGHLKSFISKTVNRLKREAKYLEANGDGS